MAQSVGRPVEPEKPIRRATVVTDTPEQMNLLKASGHTFCDAFRLGSRIYTKSQSPAGLDKEELKAKLEEEFILQQASKVREIALLNDLRAIEEGENQIREEEEAQNESYENMASRLFSLRRDIKRESAENSPNLNNILSLDKSGLLTPAELISFLYDAPRAPSYNTILNYLFARTENLSKTKKV